MSSRKSLLLFHARYPLISIFGDIACPKSKNYLLKRSQRDDIIIQCIIILIAGMILYEYASSTSGSHMQHCPDEY